MMKISPMLVAVASVTLGVSLAGAQVTPPDKLALPTPPADGAGYALSRSADKPALAPLRANQSLTTNALLGFINSEPVFVDSILHPIDEQLRNLAKTSRNLSDFKEAARADIDSQLKTRVSNMLILSSAKAALTDEDKQKMDLFINKQRHDLLAKYGGSRALADQALKAQGSSVEKELEEMRKRITVQLYLNKQIYPKIIITRRMELEDYQQNIKAWHQQAEVELFTITLPVSRWLPHDPGENGSIGPVAKNPTAADIKNAQAKAMNAAKQIVAQLKGGADFGQEAEDNHSVDGRVLNGGLTPHVKRGSRVSQLEENYIFSLPAHTLGAPLFIDDPDPMRQRVEIIKVGDKKEARTISFAEAQDAIRDKLQQREKDKLQDEYMQNLYKNAAIEGVDRMADTTLDVAVARYATQ